MDLFYRTVDLLNEIEDIFSKIMAFKQNSGPFLTNLRTFYLERGVLQHLENPPGYGPGIAIYMYIYAYIYIYTCVCIRAPECMCACSYVCVYAIYVTGSAKTIHVRVFYASSQNQL